MTTPSRKQHVLAIGGCGYVGHLLGSKVASDEVVGCGQWHTFDLRECPACPWRGGSDLYGSPGLVGDATDFGQLWYATAGIDAMVYMAEGDVNDPASLFSAAVHGVYTALSVAKARSIRRFVLLSSLSVFSTTGGDTYHVPDFSEDAPPRCEHPDGVSVLNSEWLCRYFAETFGMSVLVLRICGPKSDEDVRAYPGQWATLAASDLFNAVGLAVNLKDHTGFEVINIAGDLTGARIDLSRAKRILGWRPTL